jgi:hypothetical protein
LGPVAVTVNVFPAIVVPTVPLKPKAPGVGMLVSLRVTATALVLQFVQPAAASAMLPPFTPAGTLAAFTDTERFAGVVALVGVTESQLPVLDGVAVNAVVPKELTTPRLCGVGVAPFTELKVNEVGVGVSVNDGAVTMKLTGICTGDEEAGA